MVAKSINQSIQQSEYLAFTARLIWSTVARAKSNGTAILVPKSIKEMETRVQQIRDVSKRNTGIAQTVNKRQRQTTSFKEIRKNLPDIDFNTKYDWIPDSLVRACALKQIYTVRHLMTVNKVCVENAIEYLDKQTESNLGEFMTTIKDILKQHKRIKVY